MTASPAAAPAATLSPPVVRGLPLVGAAPWMLRDPVGFLTRVAREHGPLARIPLGPGALTLVAEPDDLRHILQENYKNYVRGRSVDMIRPMLGDGLPLSDGPLWLRQRRTMQPAFGRARLAALFPVMASVAARYVARWRDGEVFDAHDMMMRVTRDVIVETMFSDALGADTAALDQALHEIERYVARYAFVPVRVPLWLPTPDNRAFRAAIATLDRLVYRLIDARRAAAPARRGDLLDALLEARDPETGAPMPDRQLRDEVLTMFYAGHETTANALTWATYLLSGHPEVFARLRAEADDVLADRTPTAEDVPRLAYTGAVLREVLRLYPPAWIFARVAVADDALRGHAIRAGEALLLCPYVTHRLAAHWREPERFDPERFASDARIGPGGAGAGPAGGAKSWAYLPFGAGPHVCIGNHFAMSEAAVVLATIVRDVRLVATQPARVRPRATATLRVGGPLPVRVERRPRPGPRAD